MDIADQPIRKGRLRAILLMFVLVPTAIGAAVWANFWKGDLKVAEITVGGNQVVTTREVLQLAGIEKTQKLFSIDLFAARKRLEGNTFIRSASVNREVPDRVSILVTERQPVAAMAGDRLLYLDEEGFILPPARSEHLFDLPVITGIGREKDLQPGRQTFNIDILDALEILFIAEQLGDEFYRRISEVHVEHGKDIMLYTAENGVPVVFGRGDAAAKLLKFEAFWDEFVTHHGPSELQYVDLRYEDQVVVRWNHRPDESAMESSALINNSSATHDI